jgi:DNA primase
MEGYTDVIACHLAGFTGAVATLGTALTRDHGRVLLRYAHEGVVLLFDGDRAGRAAAEKAYPELARAELVTRVALLPEGTDPADLVAQKGTEAVIVARRADFARTIDGAEDALAMWFQLKRGRLDLTTEAHVGIVIDDCAAVLSGVDDPAQRLILQSRMARHLGIDEEVFRRSLARREKRSAAAAPSAERATQTARPAPSPMARAEVDLLACVLAAPALLERAITGWAEPGRIGKLLDAARAAADAGINDRDGLLRHLFTCSSEAPELAEMVAEAADVARRIHDAPSSLETLLAHRRAHLARAAAQQIRYELREASSAGDHARVDELTRRYVTQLRDQEFG